MVAESQGTLQSRSDCRAYTHRLRFVSRRCVRLVLPPARRTRRLTIRARRCRYCTTAYLRICHEAAQCSLEEHRRHRAAQSENQHGQDQAHAALLQCHARHTFAEILTHQRTRQRASPKGERNLGHHLHRDAGHINGPEYQGAT